MTLRSIQLPLWAVAAAIAVAALVPGAAFAAESEYVEIAAGPPGATGPYQPLNPNLPTNAPEKWQVEESLATDISLWLVPDAGAPSGTPDTVCTPAATGSETCGFELHFKAIENLKLTSFVPAPESSAYNMVYSVSERDFKLNGYNVGDDPRPGDAELLKLGTLTMDTRLTDPQQQYGRLLVEKGRRVGARLELESVQPQDLTNVPEPGQLWLLVCGIAGLVALGRGRTRD